MTKRIGFSAINVRVSNILGECPEIPIDFSRLLGLRRVLSVEISPLPVDGALKPTKGGFVILLNGESRLSVTSSQITEIPLTNRQRFTIAHEIAHTFYFDDADLPGAIPVTQASAEIEGICNRIAAGILVPSSSLPERLRQHSLRETTSLEAVQLARDYLVSPEVLFRRLDELDDYKKNSEALIQCKKDKPLHESKILACVSGLAFRSQIGRPKLHSSLESLFGRRFDIAVATESQQDLFTISIGDTSLRCRSTGLWERRPYIFFQLTIISD
jgi:Zn-dependent peptidase ImmA (M78 family)